MWAVPTVPGSRLRLPFPPLFLSLFLIMKTKEPIIPMTAVTTVRLNHKLCSKCLVCRSPCSTAYVSHYGVNLQKNQAGSSCRCKAKPRIPASCSAPAAQPLEAPGRTLTSARQLQKQFPPAHGPRTLSPQGRMRDRRLVVPVVANSPGVKLHCDVGGTKDENAAVGWEVLHVPRAALRPLGSCLRGQGWGTAPERSL